MTLVALRIKQCFEIVQRNKPLCLIEFIQLTLKPNRVF